MTPVELKAIVKEVYGGVQRRLARDIGKDDTPISRWAAGVTSIEETEAFAIRLLLMMHRRKINWRKWLDEYKETLGEVENLEGIL